MINMYVTFNIGVLIVDIKTKYLSRTNHVIIYLGEFPISIPQTYSQQFCCNFAHFGKDFVFFKIYFFRTWITQRKYKI